MNNYRFNLFVYKKRLKNKYYKTIHGYNKFPHILKGMYVYS